MSFSTAGPLTAPGSATPAASFVCAGRAGLRPAGQPGEAVPTGKLYVPGQIGKGTTSVVPISDQKKDRGLRPLRACCYKVPLQRLGQITPHYRQDENIGTSDGQRRPLSTNPPSTSQHPSPCSRAAPLTSTDAGTLLTTEECLLSKVQQREPQHVAQRLRKSLRRLISARPHVIWLRTRASSATTARPRPMTHPLVAAIRSSTMVENNPRDMNHKNAGATIRRRLRTATRSGRQWPLNIVETTHCPARMAFETTALARQLTRTSISARWHRAGAVF